MNDFRVEVARFHGRIVAPAHSVQNATIAMCPFRGIADVVYQTPTVLAAHRSAGHGATPAYASGVKTAIALRIQLLDIGARGMEPFSLCSLSIGISGSLAHPAYVNLPL